MRTSFSTLYGPMGGETNHRRIRVTRLLPFSTLYGPMGGETDSTNPSLGQCPCFQYPLRAYGW